MKVKNILYKIMIAILLVLMLYVTYCSIFKIFNSAEDLSPVVIILGVIVTIFALISIKKLAGKIKEKKANIVAIVLCVIFFLGISIFGSLVTSVPTYDLSHIQREASLMVENGGIFENESYFSKYPNQAPVAILIYFIYNLGNLLNVENIRIFATIINALFISLTAFFTYLSVKRLKNYKVGLATLAFFILNPIFYLYGSYYYTDTLSMPFVAIAIYLFILAMQTEKIRKSAIYLLISGLLLAIGFKIRVVAGILLIGIIIGLILYKKLNKETILRGTSIISGFLLGIIIYTVVAIPFNIPNNTDYELPPYHFLVLGLNEKYSGKFNSEDYNHINEFKTYEEKKDEDLRIIEQRLSDLGLMGYLSLLKDKLEVNWSNGDYDYISKLTNVQDINKLYEYVAGNKKIFLLYYLQICKATLLLVVTIGVAKELFKRDKNKIYNTIYISLFGAFLFYLMWEVLSRYSLSFFPWMMLIFPIGLNYIQKVFYTEDKKVLKGNFPKVGKIIAVITIISTTALLGMNYNKYAVEKDTYNDKAVVQYKTYSEEKIANRTIEQIFKTNKKFDNIKIKFIKENTEEVTHYNFILTDSQDTEIYKKEFTSDDVKNNKYKKFSFKEIKPNGEETYKIKISSSDATNDNTVKIASYYKTKYSVYPNGTMIVDGQEKSSNMTFRVQNKIKRTYTTKGIYIILSLIIVILEIFAFYPLFRNKKEKKQKDKKTEENYLKQFIQIIKEHIQYRQQILKLAKADLIKTYRGAALGWSWAIIKPTFTIFVYWFAFAIGLRASSTISGHPFFLWLIVGLIPWFYMSDMLTQGTECLRKYSYLVTKMKFPVSTIPTFVSISKMIVHLILMVVVVIIFALFGYTPNLYMLQAFFYMILMFAFFTVWALFSSLIAAMSKDFLNLVKSFITAFFWLSGILWDANAITIPWLRRFLMLNPITFLVNGYRNCFIDQTWFWEQPKRLIYFAISFTIMLVLAMWAYRKLRKEVADVL